MLGSKLFSNKVNAEFFKDNFSCLLSKLIIYGCLLALALLMYDVDEAVKVFTAVGIMAFFIIAKNYRILIKSKHDLILPAFLLAFGLLQVIWVALFKQPDNVFTAAYRSYQNAGKLMIFSSFIILILQNKILSGKRDSQNINTIIIALSLIVCACAFYQKLTSSPSFRITLGLEFATSTAYGITGIALLGSYSILTLKFKYKDLFFISHFIIMLAAIMFTQTRAAILVFPILNMMLFIMHHWRDKKLLTIWLAVFVVVGGVTLIPFKDNLQNRFQKAAYEVNMYSNNVSNTSVGSRLAMQKVGLESGLSAPWGQSLEERSKEVTILSHQEPMINGILKFLKSHLHNEVIDTFSLKGVIGVAILIGLYCSLLYTAIRLRSGILLVTSASIIVYGLSDVILYAKAGAVSCMLFLCVSLLLRPEQRG